MASFLDPNPIPGLQGQGDPGQSAPPAAPIDPDDAEMAQVRADALKAAKAPIDPDDAEMAQVRADALKAAQVQQPHPPPATPDASTLVSGLRKFDQASKKFSMSPQATQSWQALRQSAQAKLSDVASDLGNLKDAAAHGEMDMGDPRIARLQHEFDTLYANWDLIHGGAKIAPAPDDAEDYMRSGDVVRTQTARAVASNPNNPNRGQIVKAVPRFTEGEPTTYKEAGAQFAQAPSIGQIVQAGAAGATGSEDAGNLVSFLSNFIPGVAPANLASMGTAAIGTEVAEGPVKGTADLWQSAKQSVNFLDPEASPMEKGIRFATAGLLAAGAVGGAIKGRIALTDANVQKHLVSDFGISEEDAGQITQGVRRFIADQAAKGNLGTDAAGNPVETPTLGGKLRAGIANVIGQMNGKSVNAASRMIADRWGSRFTAPEGPFVSEAGSGGMPTDASGSGGEAAPAPGGTPVLAARMGYVGGADAGQAQATAPKPSQSPEPEPNADSTKPDIDPSGLPDDELRSRLAAESTAMGHLKTWVAGSHLFGTADSPSSQEARVRLAQARANVDAIQAEIARRAQVSGPQPPGAPEAPKPEAPPRIAVPPQPAPSVPTFTTSKGSTYRVTPSGTTVRDKAPRPDVGHEGDSGPQPESQATFYVDDAGLDALGRFQTQGSAKQLVTMSDGRVAVRHVDGPNAGKIDPRSLATVATQPRVGAFPVEVFQDGRKVHFGNRITSLGAGAPAERQPPEGSPSPSPSQSPSPRLVSAEGHPFESGWMDPAAIKVKPGLQFKASEVTNQKTQTGTALAGIKAWDPSSAGIMSVWRSLDGNDYVMNGHHRLELANRLGVPSVAVHAYSEADGVTFDDARRIGALQNIRDGKGTPLDVATVLGEMGHSPEDVRRVLDDVGVSPRSNLAKDAISLMRLSPQSRRMVEDGLVKEQVAAGIADAGLPPNREVAAMKAAQGAGDRYETRGQGAALAEQARTARLAKKSLGGGDSGDLFGGGEESNDFDEEMALAERGLIAEAAIRRMASSEGLFKQLLRGRPVGSTTIDKDAQARAAAIQEFARKMVHTDPATSDVLEEQAQEYAKNPTSAQLGAATDAVVAAASKAASNRIDELTGGNKRAKPVAPEGGGNGGDGTDRTPAGGSGDRAPRPAESADLPVTLPSAVEPVAPGTEASALYADVRAELATGRAGIAKLSGVELDIFGAKLQAEGWIETSPSTWTKNGQAIVGDVESGALSWTPSTDEGASSLAGMSEADLEKLIQSEIERQNPPRTGLTDMSEDDLQALVDAEIEKANRPKATKPRTPKPKGTPRTPSTPRPATEPKADARSDVEKLRDLYNRRDGTVGEDRAPYRVRSEAAPYDPGEAFYQQVLPIFKSMLRTANGDVGKFVATVIKELGPKAGPEIMKFRRDLATGKVTLDDAPSGDSDLERPGDDATVGEPVGGDHGDGSGPATGGAGGNREEAGDGGDSGDGGAELSDGDAAVGGEPGDQRIRPGEPQPQPSGVPPGSGDGGGGGGSGDPRMDVGPDRPGEAPKLDREEPTPAERRERQLAANNRRDIVPGDMASIEATLPMLLPGQQEDVKFCEDRLAKPDGYGVLFTNGTGTGKTFTGLGIIRRAISAGKRNILIVAPSDGILQAWDDASKHFGLSIHRLEDTKARGVANTSLMRGTSKIVATTYANLRANDSLVHRNWDLVVADEAHRLLMNADGSPTSALASLRALTLHPLGTHDRTEMLHPALVAKISELNDTIRTFGMSRPDPSAISRLRGELQQAVAEFDAKHAEVRRFVTANQGLARPRVVMLSATPWAYEKSVDSGAGYLFEYPPDLGSRAYNVPWRGVDQFMIRHFGYRMRVGKLTEPDVDVDRGVMQRNFNSFLKSQGVLSYRLLDVPHDYDRLWERVESDIGRRIDEALEWLHQNSRVSKDHRDLEDAVRAQFPYQARQYLLEAIKAHEAVPYIKAHLALGRKVIVYHGFIQGGGFNPFAMAVAGAELEHNGAAAQFRAHFGDLIAHPFAEMRRPIEELSSAFPDVMLFNGKVPAKQRRENIAQFNDDHSGRNLILVQADAGKEGLSLHDTTGVHPRVLMNLGMPTAPTTAIQQEGRAIRVGQASNTMLRYFDTGTSWERRAFAETIARRASTAENLAIGESARALFDSFVGGFLGSARHGAGFEGEGTGGKAEDRARNQALSDWDRAVAAYNGKLKGRSNAGIDHFATPEPLGMKMVEWALAGGNRPNESMLEPSAGDGAIARWFPENVQRKAVEPSSELMSRLALVFDGTKLDQRFEDHDVGNKYTAIVMNPPFGHGGSMAFDHIEKAYRHLRDGGRIVAIVPRGPAADKRLEKLLYGTDEKGKDLFPDLNPTMQVDLPNCTFERAGTQVACRVLILDKGAMEHAVTSRKRDVSDASTIQELFGRLEDMQAPDRPKIAAAEPKGPQPWPSAQEVAEMGPFDKNALLQRLADAGFVTKAKAKAAFRNGGTMVSMEVANGMAALNRMGPGVNGSVNPGNVEFDTFEQNHARTGKRLFMAANRLRVSREEYLRLNGVAQDRGGSYSAYRGNGAKPGFMFESDADRAAFLKEANEKPNEKPGMVGEDRAAYSPSPRTKPFCLKVEKVLANPKIPEKMTPKAARALMENSGVHEDELKATGLDSFLENAGPAVTKTELLNHLAENQVPVVVSMKGGIDPQSVGLDDMGDFDSRRSDVESAAGSDIREAVERQYWIDEEDRRSYGEVRDEPTDDEHDAEIQRRYDAEIDRLANDEDWWNEAMSDEARRRNGGRFQEPKFEQYALPGGKNYREMVGTLPERTTPKSERAWSSDRPAMGSRHEDPANYYSTHWSEPNVVFHARFDDRTGPNGEKILHVAEIQSDWHQAGRKLRDAEVKRVMAARGMDKAAASKIVPDNFGYRSSPSELKALRQERAELTKEHLEHLNDGAGYLSRNPRAREVLDRMEEIEGQLDAAHHGVPDGPFKKTWHELAFKHVLDYAARHGYDRVTWDTGATNAERYPAEMRKVVDNIEWGDELGERVPGGKFDHAEKWVSGRKGRTMAFRAMIDGDGTVIESSMDDAVGKSITDLVGKEMGARIASEPSGKIDGKDFVIGQKGLTLLYDEQLPNVANKIGKRFGAKVQPGTVPTRGEEFGVYEQSGEYVVSNDAGDVFGRFSDRAQADALAAKRNVDSGYLAPVHQFDITPEMRRSILAEGQETSVRDATAPYDLFGDEPEDLTLASPVDRAKATLKALKPKDAPARQLSLDPGELGDAKGQLGFNLDDGRRKYGNPGQFEFDFNFQQRPGSTPGQFALAKKAQNALGRLPDPVFASQVARDFRLGRGADLVGQTAGTARELASRAAILRDPRFETLRYFFMRGDVIVGHSGYSSRLPSASAIFDSDDPRELADWLKERMADSGADGYWMLHNHPSGDPTPSPADVGVTAKVHALTPGLRGHVVIDHDRYAVLRPRTRTAYDHAAGGYRSSVTVDHSAGTLDVASQPLDPNLDHAPHPILGRECLGPDAVAQIARELQTKDGYVTVVGIHAKGGVRMLAELPTSTISDVSPKGRLETAAALRRMARANGAPGLFVAFPGRLGSLSPDVRRAMEDGIRSGLLVDAVDETGDSVRLGMSGTVADDPSLGGRDKVFRMEEDVAPYDPSRRGLPAGIERKGEALETTLNLGARLAAEGATPDGTVQLNSGLNLGHLMNSGRGGGLVHVNLGKKIRNTFVENLSNLKALDPQATTMAMRVAQARAETAVLVRKVMPMIARATGDPDYPEKLRRIYVASRLYGVSDRWRRMARDLRTMPDQDFLDQYQDAYSDLADRRGAAGAVREAVADGRVEDARWELADAFDQAAGISQANADAVMPIAELHREISTPEFAQADAIYAEHFERPMAESHASNEGVFTGDLGPAGRYYPLIALDAQGRPFKQANFARSVAMGRPRNRHNAFAGGTAPSYDTGLERFADTVSRAIRANNKAALIAHLLATPLMRAVTPRQIQAIGDHPAMVIGGTTFEATVIPITTDKMINGSFVPSRKALIPVWLAQELRPILEGSVDLDTRTGESLLAKVNAYGLAGPLDALFHTNNLVGALVSGTPALGRGILDQTIGNAPFLKHLNAVVKLATTNASDEFAMRDLERLMKLGLLPNKFASSTISRLVAETSGSRLDTFGRSGIPKGFATFLYGPNGIDIRARLLMLRIFDSLPGSHTDAECQAFVNQLGAYNRAVESVVERALKDAQISPFATAGKTMYYNGLRTWLMRSKIPDGGSKWRNLWLRLQQQLSGGAIGYVAAWALAVYALWKKWPWEIKAELGKIPIPPEVRKSAIGRALWGPGESPAVVDMAFAMPMVARGARATGVRGAYNESVHGGTTDQDLENAYKDMVNSGIGPYTSGPAFKGAFTAATGHEASIRSMYDMRGENTPQLYGVSPQRGGFFAQALENVKQGVARTNMAVGNLAESVGMVDKPYWQKEAPEPMNEKILRSVLGIAFPNLIEDARDPAHMEKNIKTEAAAIAKQKADQDAGHVVHTGRRGAGLGASAPSRGSSSQGSGLGDSGLAGTGRGTGGSGLGGF